MAFLIGNHPKCLSLPFLFDLNTYAVGLLAIINILLFQSVRI